MQSEIINSKFASHIGKLHGLFPRLCIIWHVLENCGNLPSLISYDTAQRVANFIEHFIIPHIACFYSSLGLSDDHDRVKAVAMHVLGHKLVQVTARDVYKSTRSLRKLTARDILPLFQQLVALGWLSEGPSRRGTSDPAFIVNPLVHTKYADRAMQEQARLYTVRSIMATYFKNMT